MNTYVWVCCSTYIHKNICRYIWLNTHTWMCLWKSFPNCYQTLAQLYPYVWRVAVCCSVQCVAMSVMLYSYVWHDTCHAYEYNMSLVTKIIYSLLSHTRLRVMSHIWMHMPRITTRCNTPQHAATHSPNPRRRQCCWLYSRCNTLHHTATHCNILPRIVTHCNTLQYTHQTRNKDSAVGIAPIDTHCNTL